MVPDGRSLPARDADRNRSVVEHSFGHLKEYCRITMRHDITGRNYPVMVTLLFFIDDKIIMILWGNHVNFIAIVMNYIMAV
ncbi:hypothetical protein DFY03_21300 [Escherichia coli]|nr:hypothetical protein [Escherichia coli]